MHNRISLIKLTSDISEMNCPQKEWIINKNHTWSLQALDDLTKYLLSQKTDSLMIVQNGQIIYTYDDVSKKLLVHSCRKSIINGLFGILDHKKKINLGSTLAELKIDDKEKLSEAEQQATLLDLLRAGSGVYHPAAYETPSMKERKPKRFSHYSGDFWYYNNWDFNVLGYIYSQFVNEDIYRMLHSEIAIPLLMQDFQISDGKYIYEEESKYPAYDFKMTTRDLARFGLLYLNNGTWNGEQLFDENWVTKSMTAYSSTDGMGNFPYGGYGLLWWITDFGYIALGAGGHFVAIVPSKSLKCNKFRNTIPIGAIKLKCASPITYDVIGIDTNLIR